MTEMEIILRRHLRTLWDCGRQTLSLMDYEEIRPYAEGCPENDRAIRRLALDTAAKIEALLPGSPFTTIGTEAVCEIIRNALMEHEKQFGGMGSQAR